jgi:RNA polymerase-binding transcription factor DksA
MATKRTKRGLTRPKAATADVLGNGPRNDHVPAKWKMHYRLLVGLRNQLTSRQGDVVKDVAQQPPAFSQHMADAGTDSFDRDFALSRLSSENDAVCEIDQALDRIRKGSYGICELTGKPIERERLQAIPWTRFSTAAERELETEGTVQRPHLAPREAVPRGPSAAYPQTGSTKDESSPEK